jgi:hypothetical protein
MVAAGLVAGLVVQNLAMRDEPGSRLRRSLPLIAVIITINVMSVLDAVSTLYLVGSNLSKEMNPVMAALIERSHFLFFAVKLALTLTATLACWHYYESKKRARLILKWTSRVYCTLLAWHCLLLSSTLL